MGANVTLRAYENRYRAEIVDWLLGNVGDWQKLRLVVRFGVEVKISSQDTLLISDGGNQLTLGNGRDWSSYGFDIGDNIVWENKVTIYDDDGNISQQFNWNVPRVINQILGDTIVINTPLFLDEATLPYYSGDYRVDDIRIYSDKQPQGAIITYGHLTNEDVEGFNLASFIDGTETRIKAEDMHLLTGWQFCDLFGIQSGMSIRSATWNYWGKIGTHEYQYAFDIEFMISSFFEDLTNFETQTAPSQVFDAESLTDNFHIVGYPEWNNPNARVQNEMSHTKRLGNTGWFNENFNGLENEHAVVDLTYTDVATGTQTQQLSYGSETRVRAVISGVDNLANGLTKCGIGFIWLPEEEQYYKEKETPFHENLMVNTAGGYGTGVFTPSAVVTPSYYNGFSSEAGRRMDVKDVHFSIQGSNLVYEATFVPTTDFKNFIDEIDEAERNYALWVSVADRNEVTNFSDRVSLLLDYNEMELTVPPVGEWSPMEIQFFEHPQDGTQTEEQCSTDYKIEDDLLAKIDFGVDINDSIPTAIEFVIEAERISDGIKYELQSYKIDLSGYPNDSNGIPQWDYDEIRGFKLENGNNKNWVKVKRNPATDNGSIKGYLAHFGFKIRWEDWLLRTGVPSDFFDTAIANNGNNNDWYHYLQTAGWDINFTVYTYAQLDGLDVKYVNEKPFMFKDYDSNPNVIKSWDFIRVLDNSNINAGIDAETGKPLGVIIEGEQIKVCVTYQRVLGTFSSVNDVYGTICIEVDKGAGQFEFRQLSSIWGSESDNPLIPVAGETKLKKTLVNPSTIKLECLVEPALLQDAIRYKLSSRLGCKDSGGAVSLKECFYVTLDDWGVVTDPPSDIIRDYTIHELVVDGVDLMGELTDPNFNVDYAGDFVIGVGGQWNVAWLLEVISILNSTPVLSDAFDGFGLREATDAEITQGNAGWNHGAMLSYPSDKTFSIAIARQGDYGIRWRENGVSEYYEVNKDGNVNNLTWDDASFGGYVTPNNFCNDL